MGKIIFAIFILPIILVMSMYDINKHARMTPDEVSKEWSSLSAAVFGDGTYQIELMRYHETKRQLFNVSDSSTGYLMVDKYIIVNGKAYCIGRDETKQKDKYAIVDLNNEIVTEAYDISEFSEEEQDIFKVANFRVLEPESGIIEREWYE